MIYLENMHFFMQWICQQSYDIYEVTYVPSVLTKYTDHSKYFFFEVLCYVALSTNIYYHHHSTLPS